MFCFAVISKITHTFSLLFQTFLSLAPAYSQIVNQLIFHVPLQRHVLHWGSVSTPSMRNYRGVMGRFSTGVFRRSCLCFLVIFAAVIYGVLLKMSIHVIVFKIVLWVIVWSVVWRVWPFDPNRGQFVGFAIKGGISELVRRHTISYYINSVCQNWLVFTFIAFLFSFDNLQRFSCK